MGTWSSLWRVRKKWCFGRRAAAGRIPQLDLPRDRAQRDLDCGLTPKLSRKRLKRNRRRSRRNSDSPLVSSNTTLGGAVEMVRFSSGRAPPVPDVDEDVEIARHVAERSQ